MKMINKIIRSMQDTGLIDGMSLEDCDTLATAALEGVREPSEVMLNEGEDTPVGPVYVGRYGAATVWKSMIDAALNE